jgi:hypothetical protein
MSPEEIYAAELELARYNSIMFQKEILTQEEYEFCKAWDAEEASKYLFNMVEDRYLNLNVYSEVEKEEFDLKMEQGI